jgi:hypothetical protein
MPESRSELKYPVLVTQRRGEYRLRIPELLISVRSQTLQAGLDEVRARIATMLDSAGAIDALDEVPPPRPLAPLRGSFPRAAG